MVKKENIAIIPARGGSKRIPKKNIIVFYEKPMIAWTIEAAIKTNIFDNVLVSTDDNEIAKIAKNFGAYVPFLRDKYCDDHSSISQATLYTIEQIEILLNKKYTTVVQLMPNCPLRNKEDIINSYNNFVKANAKFQISCFKTGWINPWWSFKINKSFKAEYIFPEALKKRSQDLEALYYPTGAIWIANVSSLKKSESFYTNQTNFFPIDWKSAIDIDNYEDLEMAKAWFSIKNN
ncbi:acylneuraminate cytidylyltransferase family protein [Candidatus Babeliales bacterium]|nr:acylneuraminate cytidylyltransferase family protein [Candidatus Babeliales bacterium]